MATTDQSLPAGGPRREEAALFEVAHTAVSPAFAWLLIVFFLALITLVPVVEIALARARGEGIANAWSHLSNVPGAIRTYRHEAPGDGLWRRILSANRLLLAGLSGFERALENDSLLGQTLRPPAQLLMTGWLGAGNERVYPGRNSWVFYRPDVEYVTGPGFLEPRQLRRRIAAAPEWTNPPQPDPRQAIAQFQRDMAARGVALIVMPVPVKPSVHPEKLTSRYDLPDIVPQNPSFQQFVDDLRRSGVLVFDPSETLLQGRHTGAQYLATDTHWRPEAMETVAERLADAVRAAGSLPAAPDPGYQIERTEVTNTGDAVRMLDLPADSPLFAAETIWLRRIVKADGSLWSGSRDADVLLLGDSFTNIYTLESMGWGTSAGLAEQLSYALGRPLDRLVQNDEGAFATRATLQRDPERLIGKRVVIYQFAARELAFGDWKMLPTGPKP